MGQTISYFHSKDASQEATNATIRHWLAAVLDLHQLQPPGLEPTRDNYDKERDSANSRSCQDPAVRSDSALQNLPIELVCQITALLSPVALKSLIYTCGYFRNSFGASRFGDPKHSIHYERQTIESLGS